MSAALLISVRTQDGRYYGVGDWPPSPARLFQALLAGTGLSGPISKSEWLALEWLEQQCSIAPPIVGAPTAWRGQEVMLYMPNNDLDRVGGDPLRMAEVRTAHKFFHPYIFDAAVRFLYAWTIDESEAHASQVAVIRAVAERLYQFGRGVDMAWAWAELLEAAELEQVLAQYRGRIYRPSQSSRRCVLDCPRAGSLESLDARYRVYAQRFEDRDKQKVFIQAPRPRFRPVAYDAPSFRRVYELKEPSAAAGFVSWPLTGAAGLIERVRDSAVAKLQRALPARSELIGRVLLGRRPDGSNNCPTSQRVRIVPLPSIGHVHADRAIRRVMVEVPGNCPLDPTDVQWAFSGLELVDLSTGEVGAILTRSADDAFLEHYGAGKHSRSCIWRSVTPLALPRSAFRRRIEPSPRIEETKAGPDRTMELTRAAFAVGQALRHAEIDARPDAIRLQREPFSGNGSRAEDFAPGTRFAKERLWHLEMVFPSLVAGPLVIGDGRFLGLGVMAPVEGNMGIYAFSIVAGLTEAADPSTIARAARRAVMARVRNQLESNPLPAFFSGHEPNGEPARSSHLAFVFDESARRLLIVAPHVLDHRQATSEENRHLAVLHEALLDFEQLRAGAAGCLQLRATALTSENDSLLAHARLWESVTPYFVTHHAKKIGAEQAVIEDLRVECRRRGLPEPSEVHPFELRTIPGIGLVARLRLMFKSATNGPILLGRSRYRGGGLFTSASGPLLK